MNQPIERTYVTLNQAKLLKEKFDVPCKMCVADDDERALPFNSLVSDLHVNSRHPYYSAPEQWELVEWLRLNHGIWISVSLDLSNTQLFDFEIQKKQWMMLSEEHYDTPQAAYSAAFDYILNNLI